MSPVDRDGGERRRGRGSYTGLYDPLVANNARILDPTKASRRTDDDFDTTVYVADTLLFRDDPDGELISAFNTFLTSEQLPLEAVVDGNDRELWRRAQAIEGRPGNTLRSTWVTPARIVVLDKRAAPIDAWALLQGFRATLEPDQVYRVGLGHLLSADIRGATMTAGGTMTARRAP